jgi:hypothetical protein
MAVFGEEEGVGVEAGGDARRMETVDDGFEAVQPVRIEGRVRYIVAEAEGAAGVEIDLAGADAAGGGEPEVHVSLGNGAGIIDEVGAAVGLGVQGPGATAIGLRQVWAGPDGFLHDVAEFLARAAQDGRLGPDQPRPGVRGGPQAPAGPRQIVDVGLDIQGQRAAGELVRRRSLTAQGQIQKDEFVDRGIAHRQGFEGEISLFNGYPDHDCDPGIAKLSRDFAVGPSGLIGRELLPGPFQSGELAGRRARAIIPARALVDEGRVGAISADDVFDILVLNHDRRRGRRVQAGRS